MRIRHHSFTLLLLLWTAINAYAINPSLLPDPNDLIEGDAADLYEDAQALLVKQDIYKQLDQWGGMEPKELPRAQVRRVLKKCQPVLDTLDQAALCKTCLWPSSEMDWTDIRYCARLLSIRASLAIVERKPEEALQAMRTSLTLARHSAEAEGLIPSMIGIAITGLTCRNIPAYIELDDAPNLYAALAALPDPFIDINQKCQAEIDALDTNPQVNDENRAQIEEQLKISHARVKTLMKRIQRDMAALQCLVAIRGYAQKHDNTLPTSLDQIKLTIPEDVYNGQPFVYSCTDNKAVLSSPAPEGEKPKTALRYEIKTSPQKSRNWFKVKVIN